MNKTRILIYLGNISKSNGGTYQYSAALLTTLKNINSPKFKFLFYLSRESELQSEIGLGEGDVIYYGENRISLRWKISNSCNRIKYHFYTKVLNRRDYMPYFRDELDYIIKKNDISILHFPYQRIVKKRNVKIVTTMHDVQELHFPEFFNSTQRMQRAINYKNIIDNSDRVVVSYDHIKKDIIKYFEKPEDTIHTILLEMDNLWFNNIREQNNFDLPFDKFILYPAASWRHKNHQLLLEAITLLNKKEKLKINLICTGLLTSHYYENLYPFIVKENLSDFVIFLGIVDNSKLLTLYKKCIGVVVPTLYEAGSFPLMESILMGVPVICSNVTSLPETIGENAFVFNPDSREEIADRIKSLWTDLDYREKNIQNSFKMRERLLNTRAKEKLCTVYESLADAE